MTALVWPISRLIVEIIRGISPDFRHAAFFIATSAGAVLATGVEARDVGRSKLRVGVVEPSIPQDTIPVITFSLVLLAS